MRIAMIALVLFFVLSGSGFAADTAAGEAVYNKSCGACHNAGVMGAPKLGDKEAWKDHIHHGVDHMVENAIKGVGKMPPKGGNTRLTDDEVKAAVEYMVEKAK